MPPERRASPFLSVVTISFNQAALLRQAIESVPSQNSEAVEYLVVDAGSTDGDRAMLEDDRSAVDHLILEPDAGPAAALNKRIARARGRHGYFINADDFLLPGAVEKLRRLRHDSADADVVSCASRMVDSAGTPLRELVPFRRHEPQVALGAAARPRPPVTGIACARPGSRCPLGPVRGIVCRSDRIMAVCASERHWRFRCSGPPELEVRHPDTGRRAARLRAAGVDRRQWRARFPGRTTEYGRHGYRIDSSSRLS